MTLGEILAGVRLKAPLSPVLSQLDLQGLDYDSRRVQPGFLFFAFPGSRADGRQFATDAADRGAVAVASESPAPGGFPLPWIEVEHGRHALALAARNFYRHPDERIALTGITGTNGKTTTTALVAAIFERAGERVHLGGNIGMTMLDRLDGVVETDWVVLELSSFQIESVREPRCAIACVLNVTPDHLDRHGDFAAYAETKRRLIRFALDDAVLGFDDPITREMAAVASCRVHEFGLQPGISDGATASGHDVVSVEAGVAAPVLPIADIPLFGEHNLLNVLAAVAVARAAGLGATPIAGAVRDFHAVAHRLQTVRDEGGVLWVNDSKATNVESAVAALRSFPGRTIVWIGGGKGAGTSITGLADAVNAHARHAILNGASAPELDAALAERGFAQRTVVATLADAVRAAQEIARPGDVVLLAPGYKSFDQFISFEHRGDVFAELVAGSSGHTVSAS
jgi:UDP-N-acetylmuramoylalanine--D-glutamate ligase